MCILFWKEAAASTERSAVFQWRCVNVDWGEEEKTSPVCPFVVSLHFLTMQKGLEFTVERVISPWIQHSASCPLLFYVNVQLYGAECSGTSDSDVHSNLGQTQTTSDPFHLLSFEFYSVICQFFIPVNIFHNLSCFCVWAHFSSFILFNILGYFWYLILFLVLTPFLTLF